MSLAAIPGTAAGWPSLMAALRRRVELAVPATSRRSPRRHIADGRPGDAVSPWHRRTLHHVLKSVLIRTSFDSDKWQARASHYSAVEVPARAVHPRMGTASGSRRGPGASRKPVEVDGGTATRGAGPTGGGCSLPHPPPAAPHPRRSTQTRQPSLPRRSERASGRSDDPTRGLRMRATECRCVIQSKDAQGREEHQP